VRETHCVFCDAVLDPLLIAKEEKLERDEKLRKEKLQNETQFEKYLRQLQESEKAHHQILFKFLDLVFTIYMAILSFFIWLIALISG